LKVQRQSNEADKQKKFKNITRLSAFFPERILARKQNRTFYEGNQSLFNRNFSDAFGWCSTYINRKFGSDTDNWPRHTGDFSLFRIYAEKTTVQQNIQKTMCLILKTLLTYFLTVLPKMISRLFWLSRKTNEYLHLSSHRTNKRT
jgi:hypothetical protein